jgi:hypothetical protein
MRPVLTHTAEGLKALRLAEIDRRVDQLGAVLTLYQYEDAYEVLVKLADEAEKRGHSLACRGYLDAALYLREDMRVLVERYA